MASKSVITRGSATIYVPPEMLGSWDKICSEAKLKNDGIGYHLIQCWKRLRELEELENK